MNEDWRLLLDRLRCFFDKVNADPLSGEGCVGRRVCVGTPLEELPRAYVPLTMPATPEYAAAQGDAVLWKRLRCRHDFEYWAVTCAVIKDKSGGCDIPFVLNPPQRRVLALLEADRLAGLPLRLILLKARQWGSTLIQMYMAWIQTCLRTNWNSAIVAHVKDTSATIRGMYTKLLSHYPPELWEGSAAAKFVPFEGSANIRTLNGRDCNVGIGTAEKPDSLRGGDLAMVHLSETAFWPRTPGNSPLQVVQAVCGGVSRKPYTPSPVSMPRRSSTLFRHMRCGLWSVERHRRIYAGTETKCGRWSSAKIWPRSIRATMSRPSARRAPLSFRRRRWKNCVLHARLRSPQAMSAPTDTHSMPMRAVS